jgi:hypothetical protein
MRLSCLKPCLPILALTLACHESISPTQLVPGTYVLETVNDQGVPAIFSAGQADTSFMISANLTLDDAGHAVRSEHWRYVFPPNQVQEGTFTSNAEYRLDGDNITVGNFRPCPANAMCEGNKVGKFTSTTLSLSYETTSTTPVFLYRLSPTM